MRQIVNFILRNKNFLLFLLLFIIAFFLTLQSHSYHKSKFINSANFLTGGVYESVNSIDQYFNLKQENLNLLEENNRLKEALFNTPESTNEELDYNFNVIPGQVIKNDYSNSNNYLTINIGTKDSISEDNGVITAKGIVGIIDNTSKSYARVLSILNTNSRINAQLKKTNHFGLLKWDGKSPKFVQLTDVQKQAPVAIGDTIITGGRSTIFPKGIPIGKVESFYMDTTENYLTLEVFLFNDMTRIGHVHIIKNLDKEEIQSLEINQDE